MGTTRITPDEWFGRSEAEQLRYLEMRDQERRLQNRAEYELWLNKSSPGGTGYFQQNVAAQQFYPIPEPKRTTGMNYSTAIFLINNNVRAVRGTYQQDGSTAVFKTLDPTIKKDDLVVVPTSTRHLMTVFKVTEVDVDVDMDSNVPMEWVVDKVDTEAYKALKADEDAAISKIKSAELRKKRTDLADALFKDNVAELKALPIATMGDVPAVPVKE